MNIVCTICSDHVNNNENLFVIKCGHLYHHRCLIQWLQRSKTCPECRNKVTDKCMFRIFPTINDLNAVNAGYLQTRLDNAILEAKRERELSREKERQFEMVTYDLKRYKELVKKYELQIASIESRLQAAKGELLFAQMEAKEAKKYREENEELKKHMQTLNGLQTTLNKTSHDVEQMLEGYSDMRTIATFATALKRALCESEAKNNEFQSPSPPSDSSPPRKNTLSSSSKYKSTLIKQISKKGPVESFDDDVASISEEPTPLPQVPPPQIPAAAEKPTGPLPTSYYVDEHGMICLVCDRPNNGSPMIECNDCGDWYHWVCVGITKDPDLTEDWYCRECLIDERFNGLYHVE